MTKMRRSSSVKLRPQLVPSPLWGASAYRILRRDKNWRRIREDALVAAHYKCEICGGRKQPNRGITLNCHEVWRYSDKRRIATVVGFEIHCSLCDLVTHMGRAINDGEGETALKQMCKVNGISLEAALELYDKAMETCERRSKRKWKVKVSKSLLKRYPALVLVDKYKRTRDYEPPPPATLRMKIIIERDGSMVVERNGRLLNAKQTKRFED